MIPNTFSFSNLFKFRNLLDFSSNAMRRDNEIILPFHRNLFLIMMLDWLLIMAFQVIFCALRNASKPIVQVGGHDMPWTKQDMIVKSSRLAHWSISLYPTFNFWCGEPMTSIDKVKAIKVWTRSLQEGQVIFHPALTLF